MNCYLCTAIKNAKTNNDLMVIMKLNMNKKLAKITKIKVGGLTFTKFFVLFPPLLGTYGVYSMSKAKSSHVLN